MVKVEYTKTAEGNHRLLFTARSEADREELDQILKVLTLGRTKRSRYESSLVGVVEYKPFPEPKPMEAVKK